MRAPGRVGRTLRAAAEIVSFLAGHTRLPRRRGRVIRTALSVRLHSRTSGKTHVLIATPRQDQRIAVLRRVHDLRALSWTCAPFHRATADGPLDDHGAVQCAHVPFFGGTDPAAVHR